MHETTRIFQSAGILHRIDAEGLVIAPQVQADLAAVTPESAARLVRRLPVGGRILVDMSALDASASGSIAVSALMSLHGAAPISTQVHVRGASPILASGLRMLGLDGFIVIDEVRR